MAELRTPSFSFFDLFRDPIDPEEERKKHAKTAREEAQARASARQSRERERRLGLRALGMPQPDRQPAPQTLQEIRENIEDLTGQPTTAMRAAPKERGFGEFVESAALLDRYKKYTPDQLQPHERDFVIEKTPGVALEGAVALADIPGEVAYRGAQALGASEPVAMGADVMAGLLLGGIPALAGIFKRKGAKELGEAMAKGGARKVGDEGFGIPDELMAELKGAEVGKNVPEELMKGLPDVPEGYQRLYRWEGKGARKAGAAGGVEGGQWFEKSPGAYYSEGAQGRYIDLPEEELERLGAFPGSTEFQLPEDIAARAQKMGAPTEGITPEEWNRRMQENFERHTPAERIEAAFGPYKPEAEAKLFPGSTELFPPEDIAARTQKMGAPAPVGDMSGVGYQKRVYTEVPEGMPADPRDLSGRAYLDAEEIVLDIEDAKKNARKAYGQKNTELGDYWHARRVAMEQSMDASDWFRSQIEAKGRQLPADLERGFLEMEPDYARKVRNFIHDGHMDDIQISGFWGALARGITMIEKGWDWLAGKFGRGSSQAGFIDPGVKTSSARRLFAWARAQAMLSNPSTHLMNLASTETNIAMDPLRKTIQAGTSAIMHPFNSLAREVTGKEVKASFEGFMKGFFNAVDGQRALRVYDSGGDLSKRQLRDPQRLFGKPVIDEKIEKYSPLGFLKMEDDILWTHAYTMKFEENLARYSRKLGYKPEKLRELVDDYMNVDREFAKRAHPTSQRSGGMVQEKVLTPDEEALVSRLVRESSESADEMIFLRKRHSADPRATFMDQAANAVEEFAGMRGPAGFAVETAMPFRRTPLNVARETAKHSPIGFLQMGTKKGRTHENFSKAVIGSGTLGLGYMLARQGWMTGEGPMTEGNKRTAERAGHKPSSISIPVTINGEKGHWYIPIDRLEPLGTILTVGATIHEREQAGEFTDPKGAEHWQRQLMTALEVMDPTERAFMQPLEGLVSLVNDPAGMAARKFTAQVGGTFVPAVVKRANQAFIDPTVRDYGLENAKYPFIEDLFRGAAQSFPGVSKTMPARKDIYGEDISRVPSGDVSSKMATFLAPGAFAGFQPADPEAEELQRLNVGVGLPSDKIEVPNPAEDIANQDPLRLRLDLNPEEQALVQELKGSLRQKAHEKLMASDSFRNLPDVQKRKVLENYVSRLDNRINQLVKAYKQKDPDWILSSEDPNIQRLQDLLGGN